MTVDGGPLATLLENRGRCVEVGFWSLAIFRLGDEVFALENPCPHRGGPLCEGDVRNGVVYCPLHAWGFELRTGTCVNVPRCTARTFPVRVVEGRISVEVEDSALNGYR